jgi:endonuclease III related protein
MKKTALPAAAPALRRAYDLMREYFGHLQWWPGETPFEVCVGAILTQNTAWTNVERAIGNLKAAGVLAPQPMLALPEADLAALIRPAGYFNVKARRLRAFLRVLVEDFGGEIPRLFTGPTPVIRVRLLAIHGIGPETADSMLLYAGGHHSFVIDAYTKRIFTRHGWWKEQASAKGTKTNTAEEYHALKALCEAALPATPDAATLDLWQDYHAQLVMVGKHFCTNRNPKCAACPLAPLLPPSKNLL